MTRRDQSDKAILIAGPTASGKSGLAMALADALGGTIINADSMQVYAELRILTARPSAEDEARVPHLLYGHVPASEAYSAGRFVVDAGEAIAAARAGNRVPIIVGGTGLYFRALLEGLAPVPEVDAEIRAHWRSEAAKRGATALHDELARRDPVMAARLAPTDTQRIVRALEVVSASGRSLAEWQTQSGAPVLDESNVVRLLLAPDRQRLQAQAEARFEAMMVAGAMGEAEALGRLGLDPALPAMRAIGVRPLLEAARGETTLDDAVSRAKAETRQLIKRQQTWANSYMIAWKAVEWQLSESNLRDIIAFIQC